MLYRVALQGFAEPDRSSLASFLRETSDRQPAYHLVHLSSDADLILADGDSAQVIANVVEESRISTTLFLSEQRPLEAACHVARPTNPAQLLRALDELAARLEHTPESPAAPIDDARARAKAAARRAARRARLAASAAVPDSSEVPPDILVFDVDGNARDHLCRLLEYFGFCAYPASNVSQAIWLMETRRFGAAFVDIALDGSDGGTGIELCRRLKSAARQWPGEPSALFIVAGNPQPVDHVLAALAGSDAFLIKPLGRGDVARALEVRGIPMPADERRGWSTPIDADGRNRF
jgi:CheY-like chemotaxis protein